MEQSSYTKTGIYTTAAKESQKKLHGELQADGSYSWERDVDSWIPFNGEISTMLPGEVVSAETCI